MSNESVAAMCREYFESIDQPVRELAHWHFCDNKKDADECAQLVLQGVKRATSPSLWWHQASGEPVAKPGELNVVTNWQGDAICIIETVAVEVVAFCDISSEYAYLEGEGDKSLAYWRQVHWDYYHRELEGTEFTPTQQMPIVCEEFKVVFPAISNDLNSL